MRKKVLFSAAAAALIAFGSIAGVSAEEQAPAEQEAAAEEETGEEAEEEAGTEDDLEEALEEDTEEEDIFSDWNEGAPALETLISYVEDVTDENSENYIPEADRIATFDMDGTLCAELCPTYLEYYLLAERILVDPTYEPDAEMLEFGRMLRDHALDKSFPDHMDLLHANHAAKAYAGMTLDEFSDFVNSNLVKDVDGFEGMTYAESFYLPMIQVIEYLQDNDFKVYVVSGSDRFICRTFVEGMIDIPYENIIGMDVALCASNQGDTDGLDYVFTSDDTVIRTDKLLIKNLKMNKILQILQDIGKQPVLSFGNSGGDESMHNFTIFNNKYKSAAFMLIADDEERDYGNTEKAEELRERWEADGFNVISMRDDFRTIYGDDVVKTGEFHWLEDLAEDRTPVDAEEASAEEETEDAAPAEEAAVGEAAATEEAAPAEEAVATEEAAPAEEAVVTEEAAPAEEAVEEEEVQYVMYLGTNDKDTNMPVFTEDDAKEKAKEILIKHFGGYTIQEAHGGWVDGDKLYQEYTIVIYLSDTNEEAVHAAADEMVEEFHQSSVLIQKIPSTAEFYAPAA